MAPSTWRPPFQWLAVARLTAVMIVITVIVGTPWGRLRHRGQLRANRSLSQPAGGGVSYAALQNRCPCASPRSSAGDEQSDFPGGQEAQLLVAGGQELSLALLKGFWEKSWIAVLGSYHLTPGPCAGSPFSLHLWARCLDTGGVLGFEARLVSANTAVCLRVGPSSHLLWSWERSTSAEPQGHSPSHQAHVLLLTGPTLLRRGGKCLESGPLLWRPGWGS